MLQNSFSVQQNKTCLLAFNLVLTRSSSTAITEIIYSSKRFKSRTILSRIGKNTQPKLYKKMLPQNPYHSWAVCLRKSAFGSEVFISSQQNMPLGICDTTGLASLMSCHKVFSTVIPPGALKKEIKNNLFGLLLSAQNRLQLTGVYSYSDWIRLEFIN